MSVFLWRDKPSQHGAALAKSTRHNTVKGQTIDLPGSAKFQRESINDDPVKPADKRSRLRGKP